MTQEQSLRQWVNGWPERARRLLRDVQAEFVKATIAGKRGRLLHVWRTWSDLAGLMRRAGMVNVPDPPSLAEIGVQTRGRGKCVATKHEG